MQDRRSHILETDYNLVEDSEIAYEGEIPSDRVFNTKETKELEIHSSYPKDDYDFDTIDHRKGRVRSVINHSLNYSNETGEQMRTSSTYKNSFVNISRHSYRKLDSGVLNASEYYNLGRNSKERQRHLGGKRSKLESSLEKEMGRLYSRRMEIESGERKGRKIKAKSKSKSTSRKRCNKSRSRKRKRRRFKIPNNMEKRINKRKSRSKGSFITAEEKEKETPRSMYKFKNRIEEGEKVDMKVDLDMLHTKELLSYYKEVLNKSKKDFVMHQREQNQSKFDYY